MQKSIELVIVVALLAVVVAAVCSYLATNVYATTQSGGIVQFVIDNAISVTLP